MSAIKIRIKDKDLQQLKDICKSFNNEPGELINVLHKTQSLFGYLPAEVQEVIARQLKISVAKVYGVVTFYSFFTMVPKGQVPHFGLHRDCLLRKGSRKGARRIQEAH
jgi:NADP-reducing hydrogenase subunit HndA